MKTLIIILIVLFSIDINSQNEEFIVSGNITKIWKKRNGKVLAIKVDSIKICNVFKKIQIKKEDYISIIYIKECIDKKCKVIQNNFKKWKE